MIPAAICAACPRLCRHVCPVSVATSRESATPTAMGSLVLLRDAGQLEAKDLQDGLDLCVGCGACTRHCHHEVDVTAWVRASRPAPSVAPLPAVPASPPGQLVHVRISEADGAPDDAVCVESPDALGHTAWLGGNADVLSAVSRHFAGRVLSTDSFAVEQVLTAAGMTAKRRPAPAGHPVFQTCWEGATGKDGLPACCGARDGFADRRPSEALTLAAEVVQRLAGVQHSCADAACARRLRDAGGDVKGPDADDPR